MRFSLALVLALAALPSLAQKSRNCVVDLRGNEVCGTHAGQCTLDRYRGAWCAPANGMATKDRYGEVVCGAGACIRDIHGEVVCAAEAGGVISKDVTGQATCTGGCVPASQSACRQVTPN